MPKMLDVLIGLATVMLCFSLGVTVVTQAAVSLFNRRGKCLLYGIERLLRQVWPQMDPKIAKTIANFLLKHPLITTREGKLAAVLQREEMVFLLLEGAAGESPLLLAPEAQTALRDALSGSGIKDPAAVLAETRSMSLELERLRPELAASERKAMAILKSASSPFTAKLFGWFDQTIDRVTERFTAHAHMLSFVMATLVTIFFQLDSIWVIQRLSSDDATRTAVVEQAQSLARQYEQMPAGEAASSPGKEKLAVASYDTLGLIQTPGQTSLKEWLSGWTNWHRISGAMLSILLLSMGAPFWYSTLQNFIRLKSVLSGRDDEQRYSRQSLSSEDRGDTSNDTPPSTTADAGTPDASTLDGERRDLSPVAP